MPKCFGINDFLILILIYDDGGPDAGAVVFDANIRIPSSIPILCFFFCKLRSEPGSDFSISF